jgi:5-methylcytosine-specific restriction endonuclease McrA
MAPEMRVGLRANRKAYVRLGIYRIEEVLPFVFSKQVKMELRLKGVSYTDKEWVRCSRRIYITKDGRHLPISMGSHRYLTFLEKGLSCVRCGIKGVYFALERGYKDNESKAHFNLYAVNENGAEVMMTKDHIIPKSKGGPNRLENYQTMCIRCNGKKADKLW